MKQFFLSFDILSPSPQIYYLSYSRYNNSCGASMSLLSLLITISFFIYFLTCFILGSDPSIYSYVEPIYSSELDLSNKQIRFKLIDQYNNEINPHIAQVIPFITTITNSSIENHYPLNTSKCEITDLLNRNQNYLTDLSSALHSSFLSNYTCISSSMNSFSKLSFNNTFQSFITAYVAKCVNNTKNNRNCLSSEDIDIYLIKNKIYLLMYIDNIWVNHTQKNPFIKSYSMRKIEIDLTFYYKYYYSFQEVKYSTDSGIVFQNLKDKKMFTFDSNNNYNANNQNNIGNYKLGMPNTIYTYYPNCIMEAVFSLNREFRLTYIRVYQKLQSMIAHSGGFCFIIIAICKFLVYIFTNGKMFVEILTIRNKLEHKRMSIMLKDKENSKSMETSSGNINNSKIAQVPIQESGNLSVSQSHNDSALKMISSLNNNNNSLGIVSYNNIYSKMQDKSKDKNNNKNKNSNTKKNISFCDSFAYFFTCIKSSSMRFNFIKYCELTIKSKLSSEDLIYKLNDLELLINSNLKEIKPQTSSKGSSELLDDEKTNLIEIKETSEYSGDNDDNDDENENNKTKCINFVHNNDKTNSNNNKE